MDVTLYNTTRGIMSVAIIDGIGLQKRFNFIAYTIRVEALTIIVKHLKLVFPIY